MHLSVAYAIFLDMTSNKRGIRISGSESESESQPMVDVLQIVAERVRPGDAQKVGLVFIRRSLLIADKQTATVFTKVGTPKPIRVQP